MKRFSFLLIPILIFSCAKSPSIIGTWEGNDNYGSAQTVIFKEGGVFVKIKGDKVENSQNVSWQTDDSKTPHNLDIIYSDSLNKEEIMRVKGIYEFLDDNTIRVCYYESDYDKDKMLVRPKSFDEGKTRVFKRSK